MSIECYAGELRDLGAALIQLADWYDQNQDGYDFIAQAHELEAKGLLDPVFWGPKRWVIDAILAARCEHKRVIWADGGRLMALLCQDCGDCCYNGEFDDVSRFRVLAAPDVPASYPEGAAITPIHYASRQDVSYFDLLALGVVNGSRDPENWLRFCASEPK